MLAAAEQVADSIAITVQVLEELAVVQTAVQVRVVMVLLRQRTLAVAAVAAVQTMIAQRARAALEAPAFASSVTQDKEDSWDQEHLR
jgi:hypothetical protein